jgi:hypothetical protein
VRSAAAAPLTTPPASPSPPLPQLTHFQLQQQKEQDAAEREEENKQRQLAARREVSEDHYVALVDTQNTNRQEDVVEARGMEQAIDALSALNVNGTPGSGEKHPEK